MQTTTQRKTNIVVRNQFRLLVIILFISCISGVLSAQQALYSSADESRGQWFFGFSLGPRIYFSDHARQLQIIDRLSGGADMYGGKWWGPYIGTRVGATYQTLKGATQTGAHVKLPAGSQPFHYNIDHNRPAPGPPTNPPYFIAGHRLWQQQLDSYHIFGDVLFDISSIFQGPNENRFWTLTPYVGVGFMGTFSPAFPRESRGKEVSANIGLLNSLRLSRTVDLNFDLRGAMVGERFNSETGERPFDGVLSVNLGVTFRFGKPLKSKPVYHHQEYTPETIVEKITEWKEIATDVLILFRIGQSTLSKDARVQLGFLAKLMHEFPSSQYTITGYADEGTGNPNLNYRLSQARADRVRDCLVSEFGVPATRLKTVAAGGVENQYYNDPALSRSAIVRPDKN